MPKTSTVGKFIYVLFTTLYPLFIRMASPFNEKARCWVKGRRQIFNKLQNAIKTHDPLIWMHCASLGEFEQGRPVLEDLRRTYTGHKILITFFSASGYEVQKDYQGADYIFYLPADSRSHAARFFDIVKPRLILFVKYEFWYFYLREARRRNVPLLLVSAIFRPDQVFFKGYGHFYRNMLSFFTTIFVQNTESKLLLNSVGYNSVQIAGDTRFDRVIEIAEKFTPVPHIDVFSAGKLVVVAGSTWSEDDKELSHFINSSPQIRAIIAPHHLYNSRLQECGRLYKNSVLYSQLSSGNPANATTLIIDNIGMLSRLYKYAAIAYVGGGFGEQGIHNILEAAVYGIPVVFGPEYGKYAEAVDLVELGGAISVDNALELEKTFRNLLSNTSEYQRVAEISRRYVFSRRGATEKIMRVIQENRLLTS